MEKSIRIIYDEHRSMAAVLHGLKEICRALRDPSLRPEFPVLHAMIHYIDAFPERLHHPKEEKYLFARLEQRAPDARPLIEELRAEHVVGARLVRDLEAALIALEVNGPSAADSFATAVDAYAEFHWAHMRKEEDQLLPLALRHFRAEDWSVVNEAFAGNDDPIADLREKDFEQLFKRIVSLAPAPIGLGERWKKAG